MWWSWRERGGGGIRRGRKKFRKFTFEVRGPSTEPLLGPAAAPNISTTVQLMRQTPQLLRNTSILVYNLAYTSFESTISSQNFQSTSKPPARLAQSCTSPTPRKPQDKGIIANEATAGRVVYALIIINKAGGLVYQRDFAEGLNKLSINDYLVLAGTFHGYLFFPLPILKIAPH